MSRKPEREAGMLPEIIYELDAKVYHGKMSVPDALAESYRAGAEAQREPWINLQKYLRHKEDCTWPMPSGCNCGLASAYNQMCNLIDSAPIEGEKE